MNKGLLHSLIFVTGVVVGGTTVALISHARNKNTKQELEDANGYIDELEKNVDELSKTNMDLTEGYKVIKGTTEENEARKMSKILQSYGTEAFKEKKKASTIEKSNDKNDETDDDDRMEEIEKDAELILGSENDDDIPFEITSTEYVNGFPEYEKISCMYFMDDHQLVDDDTEEIMDVAFTIGTDIVETFSPSNRQETKYVRAHDQHCDYEIVKMPGSFEDYLGLDNA